MKSKLFILLLFCHFGVFYAQFVYEPSAEHPFGLPNPEAPRQLLDFAPLIGVCDCSSISRNADKSWAKPVAMVWRFKYIMNGMAIQDESLKADGRHAGSIRQYSRDSSRWYVHYYSSGTAPAKLTTWEGSKNDVGNIILCNAQKAPNGSDGFYKITFSEIDDAGFKWLGEWVNTEETFSYPVWKISCKKSTKIQGHKIKNK